MKRTKIIILLGEGLQHELIIHGSLMKFIVIQLVPIAQLLFQQCWRKLGILCVFADRREKIRVNYWNC